LQSAPLQSWPCSWSWVWSWPMLAFSCFSTELRSKPPTPSTKSTYKWAGQTFKRDIGTFMQTMPICQ
jgi:hypothetical protein